MGASHTSNSSQNPCLAFSPGSAILLSSLTLCSMLAALMRVALKGWKMDTNHCQQQKIREFFPQKKLFPNPWGCLQELGSSLRLQDQGAAGRGFSGSSQTQRSAPSPGSLGEPGRRQNSRWSRNYLLQVNHSSRFLHHGVLLVVLHQVREGVEPLSSAHVVLPVQLGDKTPNPG